MSMYTACEEQPTRENFPTMHSKQTTSWLVVALCRYWEIVEEIVAKWLWLRILFCSNKSWHSFVAIIGYVHLSTYALISCFTNQAKNFVRVDSNSEGLQFESPAGLRMFLWIEFLSLSASPSVTSPDCWGVSTSFMTHKPVTLHVWTVLI